jgi:hypothetical protein
VIALIASGGWIVLRLRRRHVDRVQLGVAAGFVFWLVSCYLIFSAMGTFRVRYFETASPAVAGVLGGGLYVLLTSVGAFVPRVPRPALALAAATGLVALLIVPVSESRDIVLSRAFDAERSGSMPTRWPPRINDYLEAHSGNTRYSFASVAPAKAAPLIVDDPRPVLMLTSYRSRPLLSVQELAQKVRAGQVRYFLIGQRCRSKLTRNTAACPDVARWAIAHSTDVTREAGIRSRGLLYRINWCRRAVGQAPGRGRSATRSATRRSAPNGSHANLATCVQRRRA